MSDAMVEEMKEMKCLVIWFSICFILISISGCIQDNVNNSTENELENVSNLDISTFYMNWDNYSASGNTKIKKPLREVVLSQKVAQLDNYIIGPLLETQWGQRDEYALYAPINNCETPSEHHRLGCWSTAFAQILYYYEASPSGSVYFVTSNNCSCSGKTFCVISDNFDLQVFNFSYFVPWFNASTPQVSINSVALYSYFTSVVLQKDYGTGSYVLNHNERADALEDHYQVDTEIFSMDDYSMGYLENKILTEIIEGRPVMLHLHSDQHDYYHAVACDGVAKINGVSMIHINMGHKGVEDGWYDFEDIGDYDDQSYRKIITVRPTETLIVPLMAMKNRVYDVLHINQERIDRDLTDPDAILHYQLEDVYSLAWVISVGDELHLDTYSFNPEMGEQDMD